MIGNDQLVEIPQNDNCTSAEVLAPNEDVVVLGRTMNATVSRVCEGSRRKNSLGRYIDSRQYSRNIWYRFVGTGGIMR